MEEGLLWSRGRRPAESFPDSTHTQRGKNCSWPPSESVLARFGVSRAHFSGIWFKVPPVAGGASKPPKLAIVVAAHRDQARIVGLPGGGGWARMALLRWSIVDDLGDTSLFVAHASPLSASSALQSFRLRPESWTMHWRCPRTLQLRQLRAVKPAADSHASPQARTSCQLLGDVCRCISRFATDCDRDFNAFKDGGGLPERASVVERFFVAGKGMLERRIDGDRRAVAAFVEVLTRAGALTRASVSARSSALAITNDGADEAAEIDRDRLAWKAASCDDFETASDWSVSRGDAVCFEEPGTRRRLPLR